MPEQPKERFRETAFDALILAGRRGDADELAEQAGATHRALIELDGAPMLERVVATLRAVPAIGRIVVSIDRPELARREPGLAALEAAGAVGLLEATRSPSRSVLDALDRFHARPLLLTTADHPLLTPEMVTHFLDRVRRSGADVAVGLVSERVVRERFPESKRTYLAFRDGGYSGANLFAFQGPDSRRAAEFWTRAERLRKRPWRLAASFGLWSLALFLGRRLTLADAMRRASRTIGARVEAIPLPFARAAVDVDRMGDLILARRLLAADRSPAHV
ncbi:MAG: nucleotidyltransferase family protein [Gemmatimonadales bacterium]